MEMDGLLHENKLLNEAILKADRQRYNMTELATLLQNEKIRLEDDLATIRQQVEELSAKNDNLNVQLGVITEREREANAKIRAVENQKAIALQVENQKKAEIVRDNLKREQALAAITIANLSSQSPFRVYDSMFVGKKEISGRLRDAGRLSIRNYTDDKLEVTIESANIITRVHIPPNTSSNGIYVAARKGEHLFVKAAGHTDKITW